MASVPWPGPKNQPPPEPPPQWEDPTKEQIKIKEWRVAKLRKAGLDKRRALMVESVVGPDSYKAVRMLEAGCSPELVLKILL